MKKLHLAQGIEQVRDQSLCPEPYPFFESKRPPQFQNPALGKVWRAVEIDLCHIQPPSKSNGGNEMSAARASYDRTAQAKW
jgi:hypothetical protein